MSIVSVSLDVDSDDAQLLRDLKGFTRELLKHADALPPVLASMLRDYASELHSSPPERWSGGIGGPAQYGELARWIGQKITDGEFPEGKRLDWSPEFWYARVHRREIAEKAFRLLAARGELISGYDGTYYVGRRDGSP